MVQTAVNSASSAEGSIKRTVNLLALLNVSNHCLVTPGCEWNYSTLCSLGLSQTRHSYNTHIKENSFTCVYRYRYYIYI